MPGSRATVANSSWMGLPLPAHPRWMAPAKIYLLASRRQTGPQICRHQVTSSLIVLLSPPGNLLPQLPSWSFFCRCRRPVGHVGPTASMHRAAAQGMVYVHRAAARGGSCHAGVWLLTRGRRGASGRSARWLLCHGDLTAHARPAGHVGPA
jgi:hypothetical protein